MKIRDVDATLPRRGARCASLVLGMLLAGVGGSGCQDASTKGEPPAVDDDVASIASPCDGLEACATPGAWVCSDGDEVRRCEVDALTGCTSLGPVQSCDDADACTLDVCDTQVGCL